MCIPDYMPLSLLLVATSDNDLLMNPKRRGTITNSDQTWNVSYVNDIQFVTEHLDTLVEIVYQTMLSSNFHVCLYNYAILHSQLINTII